MINIISVAIREEYDLKDSIELATCKITNSDYTTLKHVSIIKTVT